MSSGFCAKESYHSLINFEFPRLNLIELTFLLWLVLICGCKFKRGG